MFDDKIGAAGTPAPNNLPLGEPQDIFESTDDASSLPPLPGEADVSVSPPPPAELQTSALGAGILKPKSQDIPPLDMNPRMAPPSMPGLSPQGNPPPGPVTNENAIKEPTLSRGIMITIMAVVVGFVLIGSGWFVYRIFTKDTEKPVNTLPLQADPSVDTTEPEIAPPVVIEPLEEVIAPTSSNAVDQEIITGESLDTDGDGLKDNRETELGTDPANWDTDTDGLSDGEELLIWHTNPKNSDTDGDTYKDGAEVKAGYSPSGPGRLAEIAPTASVSSTSSTSSPESTTPPTTPSSDPSASSETTTSSPAMETSDTYEIEL